MEKKMSKVEFFEAVACGVMNDEIMAKATELVEAMRASNAKRAAKQAEKADETYAPFIDIFTNAMNEKPQTASDLLPLFDGMETPSGKAPSVQFVSSIARKAVAAELADKVQVKVKGKGSQVGYVAHGAVVDGSAE